MGVFYGTVIHMNNLIHNLLTTLKPGLCLILPLDRYIPLLIAFPQTFERSLQECYTFLEYPQMNSF
jgi:hypothetical protein